MSIAIAVVVSRAVDWLFVSGAVGEGEVNAADVGAVATVSVETRGVGLASVVSGTRAEVTAVVVKGLWVVSSLFSVLAVGVVGTRPAATVS